ncbi:MAG: hypothetical protein PUP93_18930 [Rhizonema sp. NSF051]|nr:hypothetical protein [Rhizonema sp. NSF051]
MLTLNREQVSSSESGLIAPERNSSKLENVSQIVLNVQTNLDDKLTPT